MNGPSCRRSCSTRLLRKKRVDPEPNMAAGNSRRSISSAVQHSCTRVPGLLTIAGNRRPGPVTAPYLAGWIQFQMEHGDAHTLDYFSLDPVPQVPSERLTFASSMLPRELHPAAVARRVFRKHSWGACRDDWTRFANLRAVRLQWCFQQNPPLHGGDSPDRRVEREFVARLGCSTRGRSTRTQNSSPTEQFYQATRRGIPTTIPGFTGRLLGPNNSVLLSCDRTVGGQPSPGHSEPHPSSARTTARSARPGIARGDQQRRSRVRWWEPGLTWEA